MANPQRPQLPPGVLEALKAGNKIEAIRLVRESTRMGLAESKAMVEMLDKGKAASARPAKMRPAPPTNLPLRRPGLSPGEVPREASGVAAILVLVAVGLAVAFSFVR